MTDKLEKRVTALEQKLDRNLLIMQKFMDQAAKRIVKMEKRFKKVEKTSVKLEKVADPRSIENNLMQMVDKALKAYDRSKK